MKNKPLSIIAVLMIVIIAIIPMQKTFALSNSTELSSVEIPSEELQAKEDISIKKYNTLMEEWSKGIGYLSDTEGVFPDFFCGSYIDEQKNLVIQTNRMDDEVLSYFRSRIELEDVAFELADNTYRSLLDEHDRIAEIINDYQRDEFINQIVAVGLSIKDNSVKIYLSCEIDENIRLEIFNRVSTYNSIVFEDNCGEDVFTSSYVYPGMKISTRSAGYWATDSSGNLGVVTAGHYLTVGDTISVGGVTFGSVTSKVYGSGADGAFVKRTNTNYLPSRYVMNWGFQLQSGSVIVLPVGSTIYARGYASGIICGSVTDNDYTNHAGLQHCVKTDVASTGGDSGGTVAGGGTTSLRQLAGVMSCLNDGCMVYSKATNINYQLAVSVY
jgi:hypothetical protein